MDAKIMPFVCPLCGFEAEEPTPSACQSCPLHSGCTLVCCPRCGYQIADPNRSQLVAWFNRLRTGRLVAGVNAQIKKRIPDTAKSQTPEP